MVPGCRVWLDTIELVNPTISLRQMKLDPVYGLAGLVILMPVMPNPVPLRMLSVIVEPSQHGVLNVIGLEKLLKVFP